MSLTSRLPSFSFVYTLLSSEVNPVWLRSLALGGSGRVGADSALSQRDHFGKNLIVCRSFDSCSTARVAQSSKEK